MYQGGNKDSAGKGWESHKLKWLVLGKAVGKTSVANGQHVFEDASDTPAAAPCSTWNPDDTGI